MAVSSAVTLPAQPSVGSSRIVVLSGNGYHHPKSMYEVQVSLTGAAGGGNSTITLTTDPRFTSLVLRVELTVLASSAQQDYQLTLAMRGSSISSSLVGELTFNSVSTLTPAVAWWDPPPILPVETIESVVANVDGDVTLLTCWIYNYDINALNVVPLTQLLASLPRTSAQSQPQ